MSVETKVKHLDGREHLVARLERLLNQAREGKIKAIAYTIVNDDNSISTGWRYNNGVIDVYLAAGVSDLSHRLFHQRYATGDEE